MKLIPLTQGFSAQVDDEDYDYLHQWKWYAQRSRSTIYAQRRISKHGRFIYMARLILDLPDNDFSLFPDHKDHNGLNNTKENLRIATRSQNNANKTSVGISGYMGVFPVNNSWFARINKDKKSKYLGCFRNKKDAALAYNDAAKIIHGEFANLNIIE